MPAGRRSFAANLRELTRMGLHTNDSSPLAANLRELTRMGNRQVTIFLESLTYSNVLWNADNL
jgi:hypothetical protein